MTPRRWDWAARGPWERWALSLWGITCLIVLALVLLTPSGKRSVFAEYHAAAAFWRSGHDTYTNGVGTQLELIQRDGKYNYRYGPPVTAALVPLGLLPLKAGDVVWRLLNVVVLLAGLALWSKHVLPGTPTPERQAVLLALILPFVIGNIHNGQANLLLLGLLLVGTAAVGVERWNLAAVCLALAVFLKVYPLALGLLLAVLYPRRLLPRLGAALALGVLLPSLLHDPGYVWRQYALWFAYLGVEDRTHIAWDCVYVDVQLLCKVWLTPIDTTTYRGLEVAAGAILAVLCLVGQRLGWERRRLLTFTLGVGLCWMTAFGPATEAATYCLLAPVLAWALLQSRQQETPAWITAVLLASLVLLLSSQIVVWFPGLYKSYRFLGPQPVGALLLLATLIATEFRRGHRVQGIIPASPAPITWAS